MTGKFATSKAGHDKGRTYVVIGKDGERVLLCDGRTKTLDAPKQKNIRHVQMTNHTVDSELLERLLENKKVFDEEIKYAIKKYINQQASQATQDV